MRSRHTTGRRTVAILGTAIALIAAIAALVPGTADAQQGVAAGFDGPGTYQIVNQAFGRYLASETATTTGNVATTETADDAALWLVAEAGPTNEYVLRNVATSGWLDADGPNAPNRLTVQQSRVQKADDVWLIEATANGGWTLENAAIGGTSGGYILDADNAARAWDVNLTTMVQPDSTWVFVKVAESCPTAAADTGGMVVVSSQFDFEQTWENLVGIVDANPNLRIIETIDHAAAAVGAGLELEPNRVLIFGNPAIGTPLMQSNRRVAIDLPQKMQVWQSGDQVCVGYNSADYLEFRPNIAPGNPILATVAGALRAIASGTSGSYVGLPEPIQIPFPNAGLPATQSNADFDTTLARLLAVIDASPASVFLTVDHAANSGGVLPATTVVVFGNPGLGTPLMANVPSAGIDLPLKILVMERRTGEVVVVVNDIDYLVARHGITGPDATVDTIRGALANFVNAATSGPIG